MSDKPQSINITNNSPNQGPQGIFNAPIYLGQSLTATERLEEWQSIQRAIVRNHDRLVTTLLTNFVGRVEELTHLEQHIVALLPTGGYVLVTGSAGVGKSSLMARLAQKEKEHTYAHHFIPIHAGPQYETSLLRDLIAQLALKYKLTHRSAESENVLLLRDTFLGVLSDISTQFWQEVIIIDGLDQLIDDVTGNHDFKFLPEYPPLGIVFVLSTRHDTILDVIPPKTPHYHYYVPQLSYNDFQELLERYRVTLTGALIDRYYTAMEKHALYLHQLVRELAINSNQSFEEILNHISDDPEKIFALAIGPEGRLSRYRDWEAIGLPTLRILLVAAQPLSVHALRGVLGLSLHNVQRILPRLSGLVVRDSQDRYALFHIKLHSYLQREVFAPDELLLAHQQFIDWCVDSPNNPAGFWNDSKDGTIEHERVMYGRTHYTTHLYHADQRERLWNVIDNPTYINAQRQRDPSGHTYMREVDLARRAAGEVLAPLEGMRLLPKLWKYSWIHCNLSGYADILPSSVPETILLLGSFSEAAGLAIMRTDMEQRAHGLRQLGARLAQTPGRVSEAVTLLSQAYEAAALISDSNKRAELWRRIAEDLAKSKQIQEALRVARTIDIVWQRDNAIGIIAEVQANLGRWEDAYTIIQMINENDTKVRYLRTLVAICVKQGHPDTAQSLVKEAQTIVQDTTQGSIHSTVSMHTNLGIAIYHTGDTDTAYRELIIAQDAANNIISLSSRTFTLYDVASAWISIDNIDNARGVLDGTISTFKNDNIQVNWSSSLERILDLYVCIGSLDIALKHVDMFKDNNGRAFALRAIAISCGKRGEWDAAIDVTKKIKEIYYRSNTLTRIVELLVEHNQIEYAESVAPNIEISGLRAEAFGMLAVAYAEIGQFLQARDFLNKAIAVVREERHIKNWDDCLAVASKECLQSHSWLLSIATAKLIITSSRRAQALENIIATMIDAEQWHVW